MTNRRTDTRKDYRHLPAFCQQLLENFDTRGEQRLGPMTRPQAKASARMLYRYKMLLIDAVDSRGDPFAKELLDIFNSGMLTIQDDEDGSFIIMSKHPLGAAIERLQQETEHG